MGGRMSVIVSIRNLSKHFKKFSLKDINLEIEEGCIYGLVGKNGAGKSTLLKHLLGLIPIESGSIEIFGKEFTKHEEKIKEQVGFVLDHSPFFNHLSGEDNKKAIATFYKDWDEDYFQELSKQFELNLPQKVKTYSKGQRMKLAIAIAIAHHPKLLILDEPTSGLDPVFRDEFLNLLQELVSQEKCTVLISTHITSDLEQISDYICMIEEGKIIFQKEKDSLLDEYRIIKGKKEDMKFWKDKSININSHLFGFEGLIESKYLINVDEKNIIQERASVQEIMVNFLR
jgi:ABC-2 type transport system ATP-binding protein